MRHQSEKNTSIYYLYRYPSSSKDEFHDFLTTLELNLDDSVNSNAFLTTAIGAKSNKWSEIKGDRSTMEEKLNFLLLSLDSLK